MHRSHCRSSFVRHLITIVTLLGVARTAFGQGLGPSAPHLRATRLPALPAAERINGSRYRLLELVAPASNPTVPDARLADVTLEPLRLASVPEAARGRLERPGLNEFDHSADRVHLADGSTVLRVDTPASGQGIVRVTPRGRITVAAWTTATRGFDPTMAASPHDPWLAVVVRGGSPEHGGAPLILVPTDTEPGAAFGIPATVGTVVEPSSLCFLDGALFFGDGQTCLKRLDLDTLTMSSVVFPPSGGLSPAYVDATAAPARGGATLALGAGAGRQAHDIYVVAADGTALNVTDDPAHYEPAMSEPNGDRRVLLALDPAGWRVVYTKQTFEPHVYLQDVGWPWAPNWITGHHHFNNYVDSVVGLSFVATPTLVFAAGDDDEHMDAYSLNLPFGSSAAGSIANLTQTSSTPLPPFEVDSRLEPEEWFTSGNVAFLTLEYPDGRLALEAVDAQGVGSGIISDGVEAVVPLAGAIAIVDETPGSEDFRLQVFGTVSAPAVLSAWTAPEVDLAAAAGAVDGSFAAVLVTDDGTNRLIIADSTGGLGVAPVPPGDLRPTMMLDSASRPCIAIREAASTSIHRFDGASWTLIASVPGDLRFLR